MGYIGRMCSLKAMLELETSVKQRKKVVAMKKIKGEMLVENK